ncbi:hypothetical protein PoB_006555400 [Plakobranchus ocellatus]|uniref:Uncharacterized protein n=1 Tax=Plakobranchus ocellatus TaxID=259542 RepID=A0AAV4D4G5_9GAST|nr:hypothetical protein PoB_006555400 [Plakobranchus ocellatus]
MIPPLFSLQTNSSQTVVSQPEAVQTSSNSASDGSQEMNDPFLRIMNASSIEEVLELGLLYKGNRLATAADLGAVVDPNTHQLMVSGGHGFAVPDACNPREVTVEIQVDNLSPTSRLFPKCYGQILRVWLMDLWTQDLQHFHILRLWTSGLLDSRSSA